jgi:hypothetical protein
MEEIKPNHIGQTIQNFSEIMYYKVDKTNPVTGLFNGVRIIMFQED